MLRQLCKTIETTRLPLSDDEEPNETRGFVTPGFGEPTRLFFRLDGPVLEVRRVTERRSTGEKVACWRFGQQLSSVVAAVSFWIRDSAEGILLLRDVADTSYLSVLDVSSSRVLLSIRLPQPATALQLIADAKTPSDVALCAVGTLEGHVYVVELSLADRRMEVRTLQLSDLRCEDILSNCHTGGGFLWTSGQYQNSVPLEAVSVTALNFCVEGGILAIGLICGGTILYSFLEKSILYFVGGVSSGRVVGYSFQEPDDDPKPFLYLWITHNDNVTDEGDSDDELGGVELGGGECAMYHLEFDSRPAGVYRGLKPPCLRFRWKPRRCGRLLLCRTVGIPSATQNTVFNDSSLLNSVTSQNGVEPHQRIDTNLVLFVWRCKTNDALPKKNYSTEAALFDLNAWYRAKLPSQPRFSPAERICSFLSVFPLTTTDNSDRSNRCLDVCVLASTVRRYADTTTEDSDLFYYPMSIAADIYVLTSTALTRCTVIGVQTQALNRLEEDLYEALQKPIDYTSLLVTTGLLHRGIDFTNKALLLGCLLRTGRFRSIQRCMRRLADEQKWTEVTQIGHHWLWQQVELVKTQFDELVAPLLNGLEIGISPESREKAGEAQQILRDIALLHEHYRTAISSRPSMDDAVSEELRCREASIHRIVNYSDVCLWLFDRGILPETVTHRTRIAHANTEFNLRRKHAALQRSKLKIDTLVAAVMEKVHEDALLSMEEQRNMELYSPSSLTSLVRAYLLVSSVDTMHFIFAYFLKDLAKCNPLTETHNRWNAWSAAFLHHYIPSSLWLQVDADWADDVKLGSAQSGLPLKSNHWLDMCCGNTSPSSLPVSYALELPRLSTEWTKRIKEEIGRKRNPTEASLLAMLVDVHNGRFTDVVAELAEKQMNTVVGIDDSPLCAATKATLNRLSALIPKRKLQNRTVPMGPLTVKPTIAEPIQPRPIPMRQSLKRVRDQEIHAASSFSPLTKTGMETPKSAVRHRPLPNVSLLSESMVIGSPEPSNKKLKADRSGFLESADFSLLRSGSTLADIKRLLSPSPMVLNRQRMTPRDVNRSLLAQADTTGPASILKSIERSHRSLRHFEEDGIDTTVPVEKQLRFNLPASPPLEKPENEESFVEEQQNEVFEEEAVTVDEPPIVAEVVTPLGETEAAVVCEEEIRTEDIDEELSFNYSRHRRPIAPSTSSSSSSEETLLFVSRNVSSGSTVPGIVQPLSLPSETPPVPVASTNTETGEDHERMSISMRSPLSNDGYLSDDSQFGQEQLATSSANFVEYQEEIAVEPIPENREEETEDDMEESFVSAVGDEAEAVPPPPTKRLVDYSVCMDEEEWLEPELIDHSRSTTPVRDEGEEDTIAQRLKRTPRSCRIASDSAAKSPTPTRRAKSPARKTVSTSAMDLSAAAEKLLKVPAMADLGVIGRETEMETTVESNNETPTAIDAPPTAQFVFSLPTNLNESGSGNTPPETNATGDDDGSLHYVFSPPTTRFKSASKRDRGKSPSRDRDDATSPVEMEGERTGMEADQDEVAAPIPLVEIRLPEPPKTPVISRPRRSTLIKAGRRPMDFHEPFVPPKRSQKQAAIERRRRTTKGGTVAADADETPTAVRPRRNTTAVVQSSTPEPTMTTRASSNRQRRSTSLTADVVVPASPATRASRRRTVSFQEEPLTEQEEESKKPTRRIRAGRRLTTMPPIEEK